MKRFMVFAGHSNDGVAHFFGGMRDYQGSFHTHEEAREYVDTQIEAKGFTWNQIYDSDKDTSEFHQTPEP